jgi:hypothetical protein
MVSAAHGVVDRRHRAPERVATGRKRTFLAFVGTAE